MVALQVDDGQVLYLYGVVPGGQRLDMSDVATVEAVHFSTLVALVELVSWSEFSSQMLEQKLQSVDWVAPLARKHSAVLEEAMQYGPVIPAPLCALFSSARAVTGLLARNEQRFQEKLSWLAGRQEWGLKVFCNEDRLRSTISSSQPELQALEAAAAGGSPGQAYVLRKKRAGRLSEVVSSRIDEVVEEALDVFSSLAVGIRLRPLLSEASSGRREPMVLNAALLVEIEACPRLRAAVGELGPPLGAEGFALHMTGPWPPYSFCDGGDGMDGPGVDQSALGEAS